MAVRVAIWKAADKPEQLKETSLESERLLEEMIVAAPALLSDEWMIVGRQEDTGFGGRIDLLAVAPDGGLILLELKRDRTPRDVVAQALDYAGWVERLTAEALSAIYARFAPGRSLLADLRSRFGSEFDEDTLNQSHQVIVVAAALDESTERIIDYLSRRDIPINVLCFQVFTCGSEKLISRAWLLDPVRTQTAATGSPRGQNEPWNGEYYASFGEGENRSWLDAVEFGFISAGGGSWYTRTLGMLSPGDRVWVKVPGTGFVGVGRVTGPSQPAASFAVATSSGPRPILEVATRARYHREFSDDPEKCEYFVPIRWLDTLPLEKAIAELGMFGNQNTVCGPTTSKWRTTVEVLKRRLPKCDE